MTTKAPMIIELPKPDDFHIHLRQGNELQQYCRDVHPSFRRVLVMPNTLPPIKTPDQVRGYKEEIIAASDGDFQPLMTFKLGLDVSPETIRDLKAGGVVAGKLYPQGATTNSEDGVQEVRDLYPLLEAMEAEDLVLCIHGEDPSAFSLDREAAFLPRIKKIVGDFPKLRVVMEHITTSDALDALNGLPDRVGATITLHHLYCNLDDMIGGFLNPHLFCKPVLKGPRHQQALVRAVLQGHPKIFFGSDSAPHPVDQKESSCGCAGVYTAPVALPLLAQWFLGHGALELLEPYVCHRGADFYQLPRAGSSPGDPMIRLVEESWTVPRQYGKVVPFWAGEKINLKVEAVQ